MTDRVRIAHVTTAHPSLDNRIFRKECVALAQAGLDVALIAVAPKDIVVDGVEITALRQRRSRAGRMILGPVDAWLALDRVRPDMIHVHDPELIPLAILWRLLRRRPAVYDAHEDLAKQVMGKPYIPIPLRRPVARVAALVERAADIMLDAIVVATPAIKRNYRNPRLVLVQNFPWLRDFPEMVVKTPSTSDSPHRRGLTLSYVGGITRERGGLEMLQAVRNSPHAPELLLAGVASAEMSAEIHGDHSGRIHYLGLLPVDQVPGVIARSDAGLVLFHPLPNHLECQPTKLFEYMAAGKPFVASHFDAWQQLLGTFDCGYFIDPEDATALESVIDQLYDSPAEARARGARGRQALITHFTFETEAAHLIQLTQDLLAAHTGSNLQRSNSNTVSVSAPL